MNVTTIVAISSSVIALASLGLSVSQAWVTRKHNRLSVQPFLELEESFNEDVTSGLRLRNSGLGPAKITNSKLTFDGTQLGDFSKPFVDRVRGTLPDWPQATTFGREYFLDAHKEQFLLSVNPYTPSLHGDFRELIENRLRVEIQYDSVYGGEGFTAVYPDDD